MQYVASILAIAAIYTILCQSLNILSGYGGLVSLAQAAFCGIGAYASALIVMRLGWPFGLACMAAIAVSMVVAVVAGMPLLRCRDDQFVIATLGLQMIVFTVAYNWTSLTNGPYGLSGIARPMPKMALMQAPFGFAIWATLVAAAVTALFWVWGRSPFGRLLAATRESDVAAISLGKNVGAMRLSAFVISAAGAALAGAVYAAFFSYIDPNGFTLDISILILAAIVIGGTGNIRGPIIGALVLSLVPELLRLLKVGESVAPNVQQIIYGLLLVVVMRFRPQGIAGRYPLD